MSNIKKPLLFYNDSGSEMTVTFPIKETLFEGYLKKKKEKYLYHGNYHGVLNRDHRAEYLSATHRFHNNSLDDKWEMAKFYVTRGGKFKSRGYSNEYVSQIYHLHGDAEPQFCGSDHSKNISNILSQECII